MSFELKKVDGFTPRPGPVLLIIMDGVGLGKRDESDGVFLAETPCLDELMKSPLYTQLKAHGTAVGMPTDDDMGNSEVGHNALGAGRVFDQGAKLVANSISSGAMFNTPLWHKLISQARDNFKILHFIGLLSDGNVHAHIDHLFAMIKKAAQEGVQRVRLHVLLDGRDVYEKSALTYLEKTEALLKEINQAYASQRYDYCIASGGGRMVTTMDRYNADWSIVERGWKAHVLGRGRRFASAMEAVKTYYEEDPKITDQYLESFVIEDDGSPVGTIEDGDSVIFYNFRGDRAIELSLAFESGEDFKYFDRVRVPKVIFAGMMQYDGDLHLPKNFLVTPPTIEDPVGVYMCANGVSTFAISETQKYGHVTYFWNGNKSGYINQTLETYVEIPSDKIRFDQAPAMKAYEITEKSIELLRSGKYRFGRINFPNGDMVGHTGVAEAIIKSVAVTDECVKKLIDVVVSLKGVVVVLADHGNADEMFTVKNGKKQVSTAHSLNPVPCAIVDSHYAKEYAFKSLDKAGLANVAATLLNLLGFQAPAHYAPSLIEFKKA